VILAVQSRQLISAVSECLFCLMDSAAGAATTSEDQQ